MHHVILGTGPAGVIAADTLRKHDANAKITLIGEENEPPYSRMAFLTCFQETSARKALICARMRITTKIMASM